MEKSFTGGAKRAVSRFLERKYLGLLTTISQPQRPQGTVIFAAFSNCGFSGCGKVNSTKYLPKFCELLRGHGFRTEFVSTAKGLENEVSEANYSIVILIYNEVAHVPNCPQLLETLERSDVVFNHPKVGALIGNKSAANKFFSDCGVLMPKIQIGAAATERVFSNRNSDSGAEVWLVPKGDALDGMRYNTKFIDTRISVNNREYYTTVRLMCIGGIVTHSFVRARSVDEGNPSVHAKDTPVEGRLMNALYEMIIEPNRRAFLDLARQIADALGPGFYSHDVLIEKTTQRVFLAESGFKFDDATYYGRLAPIVPEIPSMKGFSSSKEAAESSIQAFLTVIDQKQSNRGV